MVGELNLPEALNKSKLGNRSEQQAALVDLARALPYVDDCPVCNPDPRKSVWKP